MPSEGTVLCEKRCHYESQQEPTAGPLSVPSARQGLLPALAISMRRAFYPQGICVCLQLGKMIHNRNLRNIIISTGTQAVQISAY